MTPLTFRGYGVNAEDPTIIVERITHWHHEAAELIRTDLGVFKYMREEEQ